MALKAAADAAGRPIYLEMSSVNPVVVLPGALKERGEELAGELAGSVTMGAGQFCTKPGLVFACEPGAEQLEADLRSAFSEAVAGPLLTDDVGRTADDHVNGQVTGGANLAATGTATEQARASVAPTLLAVDGATWLGDPDTFQREVFGPVTTLIRCQDRDQLMACLAHLEGNLTGTVYSAADGTDDGDYDQVAPMLADRVGRLLNDKPPTGVAVVPAMNHGGPFPATGHPGFTAVGVPASMQRFGQLCCFDNVRDHRLPEELRAANPLGLQRYVDDVWTTAPVRWGESGVAA